MIQSWDKYVKNISFFTLLALDRRVFYWLYGGIGIRNSLRNYTILGSSPSRVTSVYMAELVYSKGLTECPINVVKRARGLEVRLLL